MSRLKRLRVGVPLYSEVTVQQNTVNPTSLDSLTDVSFSNPNHGDVLSYDSDLGEFTTVSTLTIQNISGGQY